MNVMIQHSIFSLLSNVCFYQTGEKSGQVEKSKKNARQRQNDFKVGLCWMYF